jgi:hypothetical protein
MFEFRSSLNCTTSISVFASLSSDLERPTLTTRVTLSSLTSRRFSEDRDDGGSAPSYSSVMAELSGNGLRGGLGQGAVLVHVLKCLSADQGLQRVQIDLLRVINDERHLCL